MKLYEAVARVNDLIYSNQGGEYDPLSHTAIDVSRLTDNQKAILSVLLALDAVGEDNGLDLLAMPDASKAIISDEGEH